jgi:hypothetical protein
MINEANGQPSHRDMVQIIARTLKTAHHAVQTEFRLPNNKIADIAYTTIFGTVHIVEVKTDLRPYLFTSAWNKYKHHAHYLWLAGPVGDPHFHPVAFPLQSFSDQLAKIGLIEVSWDGPLVIRLAQLLDGVPLNVTQTQNRIRSGLAAGELAR